jgi:hypothetical protein
MNITYKLMGSGILIGIVSFYGYRNFKEHKILSNKKSNTEILNNNVDLGIYKITAAKRVYFKIVNNNTYALKVERIIPDCDCYAVAANKKIINPHDTLVVDAKYNAYSGPFLKKIHVYFKDDKIPLVLFFKGKVIIE